MLVRSLQKVFAGFSCPARFIPVKTRDGSTDVIFNLLLPCFRWDHRGSKENFWEVFQWVYSLCSLDRSLYDSISDIGSSKRIFLCTWTLPPPRFCIRKSPPRNLTTSFGISVLARRIHSAIWFCRAMIGTESMILWRPKMFRVFSNKRLGKQKGFLYSGNVKVQCVACWALVDWL